MAPDELPDPASHRLGAARGTPDRQLLAPRRPHPAPGMSSFQHRHLESGHLGRSQCPVDLFVRVPPSLRHAPATARSVDNVIASQVHGCAHVREDRSNAYRRPMTAFLVPPARPAHQPRTRRTPRPSARSRDSLPPAKGRRADGCGQLLPHADDVGVGRRSDVLDYQTAPLAMVHAVQTQGSRVFRRLRNL